MRPSPLFTAFLAVIASGLNSQRQQPSLASLDVEIGNSTLSARSAGNWTNQTQPMQRDLDDSTIQAYKYQYDTTGGDQWCANSSVIRGDAQKAWAQLKASCRAMNNRKKEVPKKKKKYGVNTWKKNRQHQELLLEIHGQAVAYLCLTGRSHKGTCDLAELERAEQMMACPGAPRLFDRPEDPEPPLLADPETGEIWAAILRPHDEKSVDPNDWSWVKECKFFFSF